MPANFFDRLIRGAILSRRGRRNRRGNADVNNPTPAPQESQVANQLVTSIPQVNHLDGDQQEIPLARAVPLRNDEGNPQRVNEEDLVVVAEGAEARRSRDVNNLPQAEHVYRTPEDNIEPQRGRRTERNNDRQRPDSPVPEGFADRVSRRADRVSRRADRSNSSSAERS